MNRLLTTSDTPTVENEKAPGQDLKTGDYVSWGSSGGTARGRIEKIVREGSLDVPDSSFVIEASEDDPAALIRVFQEGADGWEPSDRLVGHKLSTLTKIEPLRAAEEPEEPEEPGEEEDDEEEIEVEVILPSARSLELKDLQSRGKGGTLIQRREASVQVRAGEGDEMEFSFSSEQPVERYFGTEILSHEAGSANLERLNNGAPFLWNHDRDAVLGVVQSARMGDDRRGYSKVKWSRNAMAQEKRQDVEDGILRNVSFAYSIDEVEERGENIVVTKWTPLEVSLVSIPADNSVGLGRALQEGDSMSEEVPAVSAEITTDSDAPVEGVAEEPAATAASPTPQPDTEVPMENTPDVEVIRSKAAEAERTRIAQISALGEKFGMADLARELIDGGKDLSEARTAILEKMEARSAKSAPHRIAEPKAEVGLSDKEARSYSFLRALNYLANPGDKQAAEAAAYEREVSEAAAKAYGKPANGLMVPNEVLKRDLTAGTNSAGGFTVATDLLAGSFIELLRNKLALAQVGATILSGLQGNIAIPKQSAASTAYWVGEGNAPTESQQTLEQVTMSPKTVGAYVDYSRRLLLQSSIDVEQMVRNDLARVIALEIDRAGLYGSGTSNQPKGLVNQTGINTVNLTNYGTFAELISMETEVAKDNADAGSLFYLMNAAARGALKATPKSASAVAAGFVYEDDEVNGYPVVVSNQLTLDDIIFGAFDQMIMGMWSGLDLTLDPYAGATSGTVRIVALQDVDFAIKQAGAFCYGTGALS
jgi:HK97 family phage major capsid protein/HK97 family phage prohead protease